MNDAKRIELLHKHGNVDYVRAVRAGNLKTWVRTNREAIDRYLASKDETSEPTI
jgi:hypothetical protein